MTRDEIFKMEAGIDIDMMIITKVMGYIRLPFPAMPTFQKPTPQGVIGIYELPRYSTNMVAAWEIVEKLTMGNSLFDVCINPVPEDGGRWWAMFILEPESYQQFSASASSAPLAICRAALLAVMK
jgi:hypothetical protein